MTGEQISQRPLFGGMASMAMPSRMQDVSDFRPVPDHQEVHADGATDQSIIVEILVRSCCSADCFVRIVVQWISMT